MKILQKTRYHLSHEKLIVTCWLEIFINYSPLRNEGPPQKIQVVCLWTDYSHVTISYNIFNLFETLCYGTWHVVYWHVLYCISRTVHKSSLMVSKYQRLHCVDRHTWGFECVIFSFNDGFSEGNLMLSQTYLINLRNQ